MRVLLSILFLFFAVFAKSQNSCCNAEYKMNAIMDTTTVVVEGKIVDFSTGKGVEGVNIVLENSTENYQVISSKDGQFRFYHINSGIYHLLVSKKGYCTIVQDNLSFGSGWIVELKACLLRPQ